LRSTVRIAACAFAMTMIAAPLSAATGVSKLEWRTSGTSARRPSSVQSTPTNSVRNAYQPPVGAAQTTQVNPLRGSRRYVDSSIRPAAFEEDNGPQFAETSSSGSPVRSVVVDRNEAQDRFRSAQLPSAGGGASAPNAPAGAAGSTDTPAATGAIDSAGQLDSGLEDPVIDTSTELPPADGTTTPDLDAPPPPVDLDIDPQDQMRQPVEPPARQPSTGAQPRVPAELGPPVVPGRELPPTPQLSEEKIEEERQKSEKSCDEGLQKLRAKTIDQVDLNIAVTGEQGSDYPFECTLGEGEWHGGRCWEQTTYMWKASALCHKPLYFEDEQLERYGHSFSPCFQPFISGAHFFTRPFVLPYCMGVEPPCECIYALGHYRPGNCAPYMCNPIPISPRGALIQAGAVVGAAAALP
jgi:hypothetical protein